MVQWKNKSKCRLDENESISERAVCMTKLNHAFYLIRECYFHSFTYIHI